MSVDLTVQFGYAPTQGDIGTALKPSAMQMNLDVTAVPALAFTMPQSTFKFLPRIHEVQMRLDGVPLETPFKVSRVTRAIVNGGIMQTVECEGIVSYLADIALNPSGVSAVLASQASSPSTANLYTNCLANAPFPASMSGPLARLGTAVEVHGSKASLAGTLALAMQSGSFITLADAFGSLMWSADGTRAEAWVSVDRTLHFSAPIRGADRSAWPIDVTNVSNLQLVDDKSAGAFANYIMYDDPSLAIADYTSAFNPVYGQADAVVQYQSGGLAAAGQAAVIAASLEFTAGALSGSFQIPLDQLSPYWIGDLILLKNTGDSNLDAVEYRIMSIQIVVSNGRAVATVGLKGAVNV